MTPEITVWIPTCCRPALLETALRSVAEQTIGKTIHEVVVVENGGDRESEKLCRNWPSLPIRYVYRNPPLPPGSVENLAATKDLLAGLRTPLVALLFDDDWWTPNHLESALDGLRTVDGSTAWFSSGLFITDETGYITGATGSFVPWLAASGRNTHGRWVLTLADLIVGSQIATPFHLSSMVVERETYLKALDVLPDGNPYDTDRLMAVELARHGTVVCEPLPTVFVRRHSGQESRRLDLSGEGARWWRDSTAKIRQLADEIGLDLRQELQVRLRATGSSHHELEENAHIYAIADLARMGVLGDPRALFRLKMITRQLMPPLVWRALTTSRSKMKKCLQRQQQRGLQTP